MAIRGSQEITHGPGEAWQVADLVIDVGQQRVVRGGQEIELPKLSFDLLLALARRSPNVVSGDELMSLVWPGLVVGPETVVQRVKLLRQALGDRPDDPRYVAALRSRGYRLVAPARPVDPLPHRSETRAVESAPAEPAVATQAASAQPATPPTARWSPGRQRWAAAAASLLIVALAGGIWWKAGRPRDESTIGQPQPADSVSAERTAVNRSVAVLPFDNLSPEPEDAYLGLALPEMILNRLTTVRGLTVIARDSSFSAGRDGGDARSIGQRLGAGHLVGGSVQRNGDALRVTARLVDAQSGTQLWSHEFDGRIGDLFAIQDEIAERTAEAMQARIAGLDAARPGVPRSQNVEAYLAYLRGRALVGRFTVAEADAAAAEFGRAVELDPTFAAAHAALYDARMQSVGLRHADLAAARNEHRALLDRALQLDPVSGPAWFARAMWEDLATAEREAAYRKAMALDPGNTRGLVAFSEFLDITDTSAEAGRIVGSGFDPSSRSARSGGAAARTGAERAAESGRVLEEALRVDPLSPRAHFRLAMRDFRSGTGDVEGPILAILELDPEYYPALQRVAKYRALFHGHPAEAIPLIERAIRADPANPWGPHSAAAFYLDAADPAAAEAVARTTPVSSLTARPLLALHAGDWRAAGEAAMGPRAFEFGFNESWGFGEALRDYALHTGDYAVPTRLLRERFDLRPDDPASVRFGNYRAAVLLAHLELAQERTARAEELLHAVIRWIDSDLNSPPVYKRRARALALMLLGEQERALADLGASFRDDRDYTQWWYTFDHDPVWEPLRADPRFVALATEVRAHAARERAAVDELRRRGEIPDRTAIGASAGSTRQP